MAILNFRFRNNYIFYVVKSAVVENIGLIQIENVHIIISVTRYIATQSVKNGLGFLLQHNNNGSGLHLDFWKSILSILNRWADFR